jgi:hypothetical protein
MDEAPRGRAVTLKITPAADRDPFAEVEVRI